MRKAFTYDNHECIGVIVIILISMFANAGGLGAGAVMIPVYMIFYSFSATDSVPLSKITIFAGAIVNLILSWNTRHHKDPNRFLTNYNQAAVIIPLLLAGTQIGVILSKLFPPIAIIGGLVYFLQKTSVSMYKRAKKEWLTEQESRRQQVGKPCVTKELEMEIKLPRKLGNQILEDDRSSHKVVSDSLEKSDETGQTQPEDSSQSRPDEEGDKRLGHLPVEIGHSKMSNNVSLGVNKSTDEVVPLIVLLNQQLANFGFMILSLAVILVTALLRGGEGQESLVKVSKCSSASFIFLVFSQVVSILISFKAYAHNKLALNENSRHEGEENTSGNH